MGWLGFGQVDLISATPVFYKENYIYGPLDPIPATQIVLKKIILSKTSPKACFSHVPNPGRALAAGAGSGGGRWTTDYKKLGAGNWTAILELYQIPATGLSTCQYMNF